MQPPTCRATFSSASVVVARCCSVESAGRGGGCLAELACRVCTRALGQTSAGSGSDTDSHECPNCTRPGLVLVAATAARALTIVRPCSATPLTRVLRHSLGLVAVAAARAGGGNMVERRAPPRVHHHHQHDAHQNGQQGAACRAGGVASKANRQAGRQASGRGTRAGRQGRQTGG